MSSDTLRNDRARPLIIRFGALGDMVILTALIRALHRRFDTDIDIACGGWVRPLLEGQPGVGRIFGLYTRQLPYAVNPQQWAFVRNLRARGPGPVWICQSDDVSHVLARRAGYDANWCVTQRDYPMLPGEHAVDRLLRMAGATPPMLADLRPCGTPRIAPKLIVSAHWRDDTYSWLKKREIQERPLILVQAGNKRTTRLGARRRTRNKKYWPENHWAVVIDEVNRSSPDATILLLGVRLESLLNRAIIRRTRTRAAVDVAGEVPMQRLLALCARARAMISVDTGPAHVAAAVGCPLVVMFGAQDPSLYAPRGESSPVEVVAGSPSADHPLLGVTPGAVLAALERVLSRATKDAFAAHLGDELGRDLRRVPVCDSPRHDTAAPDIDHQIQMQVDATHVVGSQVMSQLQT